MNLRPAVPMIQVGLFTAVGMLARPRSPFTEPQSTVRS